MTRDELIRAIKALRRALHDRIVINRPIIAPDGRVVGEIRKTVCLPKEETPTLLARVKKRKEQS